MTDSNGVQWFCHRCARKDDLKLDADPVMLRVCDGCQVENWTRPLAGPVVVEFEPKPVIEDLEELESIDVSLDSSTEEILEKVEAETVPDEPERVLGNFVKLDVENVTDPYKGLTKAQLVELLKEKE